MVCLALLFPLAGGIYFFGMYTLFVVLVAVVASLLTGIASAMLRNQKFVLDHSLIVTGLLLGLTLPPRIPLWIVLLAAVICVGVFREAFGGFGKNLLNPALAGRVLVVLLMGSYIPSWIAPVSSLSTTDSFTTATPLSSGFSNSGSTGELYLDLFFGDVGGCIGETSAFLILLGGILLIAAGVIKWRVPVIYISTVFLLTLVVPGEDPIFHILAGGLFLGAFFMATDPVTTPLTAKGQAIFAIGAGILVVLIRLLLYMPEGVAVSILVMNALTPFIDRHIREIPYGHVRA